MTSATHEHTINVALGEVLGRLRRSWTTRSEQIGQVLKGGGRPDILIEEASGWPVVIEAERSNHASAEDDAKARLGRVVASSGRTVETAIALVYPPIVHTLDGPVLREAILNSKDLEADSPRQGQRNVLHRPRSQVRTEPRHTSPNHQPALETPTGPTRPRRCSGAPVTMFERTPRKCALRPRDRSYLPCSGRQVRPHAKRALLGFVVMAVAAITGKWPL